jgi:hypothetical protein
LTTLAARPTITSPALLFSLAQTLRARFARSGRHRFALAIALLLTSIECAQILLGGSGASGVADTLRSVAWCAAWSVSVSLLGATDGGSFAQLVTLRGHPAALHRKLLPLARGWLAFRMFGAAALVLGLCLLTRVRSVAELPGLLAVVVGLLALSAFFCLGLSALASLAESLSERRAAVVFLLLLIIPGLLHSGLFEVPSLVDILGNTLERLLLAGGVPWQA